MRFRVREPDGRLSDVRVSDSLVLGSIIVSATMVAWAWLSACCGSSYAQQHSSAQSRQADQIDRQTPSLANATGQQPTANPEDITYPRCCNPPTREFLMNIVETIFTGVIAFAAWQTWKVYQDILSTTKRVERAYVDLSHQSGPGLRFLEIENSDSRIPFVRIGIKNHGQTMADVERVNLTFVPI